MRAWCNGSLLDPADPVLSLLDHGLTVGDGAFEVIKIMDNQPFALTRHLRRLARSADRMGLLEPDQDLIREAVKQTTSDDEIAHGRVRITYTAGMSPLGSNRTNAGEATPTTAVVAVAAEPPPPTTAAITVPWPRNERGALAGVKSTSYAENVIALARAEADGATEAIFANGRGELCEGTGTNVFCVIDGQLVTPPLSSGCLAGITRELVLEWYDVEERDIQMAELAEAAEVFLTSTTRDVQGLHRLDNRTFDGDQPVTRAVAEAWAQHAPLDLDP